MVWFMHISIVHIFIVHKLLLGPKSVVWFVHIRIVHRFIVNTKINYTSCIFCINYTMPCNIFIPKNKLFHHTLVESTTFAPGFETRMWYFRPGYDEKSYTQHGDKEGQPRAHVCHLRLRLGWHLHVLWTGQLFTSLVL